MLKKLQINRDIVGLEAFSASNVTGFFKDMFPSIKTAYNSFSDAFRPSEAAVMLAPTHKEFERELSKHSYMDIKELSASVPEGLKVDYREYADILLVAAKHVANVSTTLSEFNVYLAQLISHNEMRLSTDDKAAKFAALEKQRELILSDLGNCFDKGSTRSDVTIAKVVNRNNEWGDVFAICEKMTEEVLKVNRVKLNRAIEDSVEMMEALERKLKAAEMDGVSPNVVNNLAAGAYQVASELEFFSVVYYRVEVFVNCVNKTIGHFQTVMKQ